METNTIILMAGLSFMLFILGVYTSIQMHVYQKYVYCSLRLVDTLCWMIYDIFSGFLLGLTIFSHFFFPIPLKEATVTILLSIVSMILLTLIITLIWKRIYNRTYLKRSLKKSKKIMESRKRLDELANEFTSNMPAPPPKEYPKNKHQKPTITSSEDGKIVYLNH